MKQIVTLVATVGLVLSGLMADAHGDRPALIPQPQHLSWHDGEYRLLGELRIAANDPSLHPSVQLLQVAFQDHGLVATIASDTADAASIVLELLPGFQSPSEEGYSLAVSPAGIRIQAGHEKGIFYAIQTLKQLLQQGRIPACEIRDWPAFPWRGYLVDVGRNFQTMELLKEQIDYMAAYKLNVFHFHFTEDIAWRLESKRYPQLTAADNMLRNAGQFYTQADLHELFAYCAERHIMLLPEIDMPGHSAAFTRALGVDMQSEQGMAYVKDILDEFCETFDFHYIHIGGDEVKITNKRFLPEMVEFLENRGKRTMGWDPGGNLPSSTIRQLWMGGEEPVQDTTSSVYVDSKHLYVNHMDPLETVSTIFYRKIGGRDEAHRTLLGGILCSWPDRAVADEQDVLWQSAVYPGLLAFAERSWRGGGYAGWRANIGKTHEAEAIADFADFESRLIEHKYRYFAGKPFPYVRQSDLIWDFYGPYNHAGDLTKAFPLEAAGVAAAQDKPAFQAVGGTQILRHWWTPAVNGLIDEPEENTTWYATAWLWTDEAGTKPFWIGFDNFSRSYASDAPQLGTWDDRKSQLWVNGQRVAPPDWANAGRPGKLEEPMTDEGYSFREPTLIDLKKGWNSVLVKVPVGTFRGKDWQNPVKWMFTFVSAEAGR